MVTNWPFADRFFDSAKALFTLMQNKDPTGGDLFVIGGIWLPPRQPSGVPCIRLVPAIRLESELQLTIRELRSQGFGASLDVREGSMLAMTLLPGA